MPKLKMLTGLCGPTISLVRGDEHECDEREASSLIRAGFAVATDGFVPIPLEDETAADGAEDATDDAAPATDAAASATQPAADAGEAAATVAKPAAAKPAPAKRKA